MSVAPVERKTTIRPPSFAVALNKVKRNYNHVYCESICCDQMLGLYSHMPIIHIYSIHILMI